MACASRPAAMALAAAALTLAGCDSFGGFHREPSPSRRACQPGDRYCCPDGPNKADCDRGVGPPHRCGKHDPVCS